MRCRGEKKKGEEEEVVRRELERGKLELKALEELGLNVKVKVQDRELGELQELLTSGVSVAFTRGTNCARGMGRK